MMESDQIARENTRLRAWLETIKDQAAEFRVIDMARLALGGSDQPIANLFPKMSPVSIVETAVNGWSEEDASSIAKRADTSMTARPSVDPSLLPLPFEVSGAALHAQEHG